MKECPGGEAGAFKSRDNPKAQIRQGADCVSAPARRCVATGRDLSPRGLVGRVCNLLDKIAHPILSEDRGRSARTARGRPPSRSPLPATAVPGGTSESRRPGRAGSLRGSISRCCASSAAAMAARSRSRRRCFRLSVRVGGARLVGRTMGRGCAAPSDGWLSRRGSPIVLSPRSARASAAG